MIAKKGFPSVPEHLFSTIGNPFIISLSLHLQLLL